jgi:hypothetical protein
MLACEYLLLLREKPAKPSALPAVVDKCTLTGRACFCSEATEHCTRRAYAAAYEARKRQRMLERAQPPK